MLSSSSQMSSSRQAVAKCRNPTAGMLIARFLPLEHYGHCSRTYTIGTSGVTEGRLPVAMSVNANLKPSKFRSFHDRTRISTNFPGLSLSKFASEEIRTLKTAHSLNNIRPRLTNPTGSLRTCALPTTSKS